jgi:hypothetical protein
MLSKGIPLYIQIMFANRLSYIRNFKNKGNSNWVMSCPLCGDSQSNKTKTRGTIFERGGNLIYGCFNCGASMHLSKFIKEIDPGLYAEYQLESLSVSKPKEEFDYATVKSSKVLLPSKKTIADFFYTVTELPSNHTAVKYLESRMIPKDQWNRIMYTEGYKSSVKEMSAEFGYDIDTSMLPDDCRVVFPFRNKEGKLVFMQGRSLDANPKIRYLTTKVEDELKLFGLELVDESSPIYVTEGPIDSMMVPNGVATADASLERAAYLLPKENLVLVFDNEPRAPVGVKKLKTAIEHGFNVVIFPDSFAHKDLNDAVCAGTKLELDAWTFRGARAMLEFGKWKKC